MLLDQPQALQFLRALDFALEYFLPLPTTTLKFNQQIPPLYIARITPQKLLHVPTKSTILSSATPSKQAYQFSIMLLFRSPALFSILSLLQSHSLVSAASTEPTLEKKGYNCSLCSDPRSDRLWCHVDCGKPYQAKRVSKGNAHTAELCIQKCGNALPGCNPQCIGAAVSLSLQDRIRPDKDSRTRLGLQLRLKKLATYLICTFRTSKTQQSAVENVLSLCESCFQDGGPSIEYISDIWVV
jgi:hypothetical protein